MTDTLTYDYSTVADIKSSGDFDYFSQKQQPQTEEVDASNIDLDTVFGHGRPTTLFSSGAIKVVSILLIAAIISFIIYYMFKNGMFKRTKKVKKKEEEEISDDDSLDIEGVDFDKGISEAKLRGEWNEIIRLYYLKALNMLNEEKIVVWQRYKTPTEYSIEANKSSFTDMTNTFLRVRYGLFAASKEDVDDMERWAVDLMKGGVKDEE